MTGDKRYELSNHLGNVLVVINDKKIPEFEKPDMPETGLVAFNADVLSYSDYYPFGMLQDVRHGSKANYRYGFNGKEKDDELKGEGNSYDYGFRMTDPRIGRFFSVDPLSGRYPYYAPYQFAGNKPIVAVDIDGLEDMWIHENKLEDGTSIIETVFRGDTYFNVTREFFARKMNLDLSKIPTEGVITTSVNYNPSNDSMSEIQLNYTPPIIVPVYKSNPFVRALRKADDWTRSLEGNSAHEGEDWIQSFNAGFKYTVEYKGYSKEYEFGLFSTHENSAGFYSTITTNIGVKAGSEGINLKNGMSSSSFSFFAKANTGN